MQEQKEQPEALASSFGTLLTTFVVLLLAGNGLLYVWSNNSDGAGIMMIIKAHVNESIPLVGKSTFVQNLNSKDILNEEVFSFTLVSSVKDFWSSQAYGLAIIIAGFSGLWPYIKLLLLMVAWLQPMKAKNRGWLLFVLDQFGKFSFVDLFVCVFMLVSFYFNIIEPPPGHPLNQFVNIKVNVIVDPRLGMNTFVVGTLLSVLINHFLIWLDETKRVPHRNKRRRRRKTRSKTTRQTGHHDNSQPTTMEPSRSDWSMTETLQGTAAHTVIVPTDIQENTVAPLYLRYPAFSKSGVFVRSFMMLLMMFVIWATIQSFLASPVRFDAGGIAGIFASEKVRAFNIVEVIKLLPQRTQEVGAAIFLDIIFVLTLVIAPALVCLLCFVIWFVPLPAKTCRMLGVFLLPCNSLACIEVFWMAAVAASVELENVSRWIIDTNGNFAKPCSTIDAITGLDCFSVNGRLISGCYWMIGAGVGTWFMVGYTRYTLNYALESRKIKKMDPLYEETDLGVEA